MTRWLLIDTWRPGAVGICVDIRDERQVSRSFDTVKMQWAVLQERSGAIITDENGHVVDVEWRDCSLTEPPAAP